VRMLLGAESGLGGEVVLDRRNVVRRVLSSHAFQWRCSGARVEAQAGRGVSVGVLRCGEQWDNAVSTERAEVVPPEVRAPMQLVM
jgi:hypothetical protein